MFKLIIYIFIGYISITNILAQSVSDNRIWTIKIVDEETDSVLETASISIGRKKDFPINEMGIAKIPIGLLKQKDSIFLTA